MIFYGNYLVKRQQIQAVSLSCKSTGYHLASKGFGSGLPLKSYKQVLLSSIFSLAQKEIVIWILFVCGSLCLVGVFLLSLITRIQLLNLPSNFPVPIFKD